MPSASPQKPASPDSQLPVLGYRILRAFGCRTPQLLDLSDQGDFWYPGWNEVSRSESVAGYQAWASPALARLAEGDIPTNGYPPILVILAGTGTITARPGFCWQAKYARVSALIDTDPTTHTQQLAAYYQVPILPIGDADPIPSTIIGQRFPAQPPAAYQPNPDRIPILTLLLGGFGAALFALGFTGLRFGGFPPSDPIFLTGALLLLLSFLHLIWQEHHPKGQIRIYLPGPMLVLHPSPFGNAALSGPGSF